MRIGIYVIRFPAPSETFIVTKALGLLDAGHDVRIFTSQPGDDWGRFTILKARPDVRARVYVAPPAGPLIRVLTVGLPMVLRTALRHPGAFVRYMVHHWRQRRDLPFNFLKGIYRRIQFVGHRLDVLHIEFDTSALGVIDLKDYLGCKVLLSSRGTFQKMSVLDEVPDAPARIFRYADGYHFISEYLRQNTRRLGLPERIPTWLIEPAIDLNLFAPPEDHPPRPPLSQESPLRVISVARLAWQKGYEFAIDAIAHVHAAGIPVTYTILGEGPYAEPAIFAARQWGLLDAGEGAGVVRFAGPVPREGVIHYLRESDVMLHAALEEGFCNAVIEAQAAGLPVVTSDAGGLPENVQDGITGFVVPRRDPVALAEKVIALARDPELRARMGRAGRVRALGRFDLKKQLQAFLALYNELIHP